MWCSSMDEDAFQADVKLAKALMETIPFWAMEPARAHAEVVAASVKTMNEFFEKLVPLSEREAWAWDALLAASSRILDFERIPIPLPREVAAWIDDVLTQKRQRPRGGARVHISRDISIVLAVKFFVDYRELKPTRGGKIRECCATGGSACDVVGAAVSMRYKNLERIWHEHGHLAPLLTNHCHRTLDHLVGALYPS